MHINHHVSRVFQTASVFIDRQAFLICIGSVHACLFLS